MKKSKLKIDLHSIQTDKRVLGRALSLIENEDAEASPWYESLYKSTGKARIWGFTGAPGAGKSSLINVLIKEIRKNLNLSVAILAIDPSSPYTGGAILGDRTRMYESGNDEKVFIRSSASRGKLGGLSSKTPEMIHILDAAGFDIIIVETVGVGQGELDIMRIADVITVVLSPHNGDSLQTLKAGIIEVADIFALNKSDLSGMNNLEKDLKFSLSLGSSKISNSPEIIKTSTISSEGVSDLLSKLNEKSNQLYNNGEQERRRHSALAFEFDYLSRDMIYLLVENLQDLSELKKNLNYKIKQRDVSPRQASYELLTAFKSKLKLI